MINETKLDKSIKQCLKKLNHVERIVFELRFGLRDDGECLLPEEIALILNRPTIKILEIEKKALRKLNNRRNAIHICEPSHKNDTQS